MAAMSVVTRTAKKVIACRSISTNTRREKSMWTADKIVKSPHEDIDIPRITVQDQIWQNLEKWADKTAIVCGLTNRSYSYHQLYKYSRNFAAKLRTHLKIGDGDVVSVMLFNSPEYAIVTLGALEAGAIVTTVNPIYTPHEVQRQITLSDPKILIGQSETIPVLKEALFLIKKNIPIITVEGTENNIPAGTISFEEFATSDNVDQNILKEVNRNSEDVAFLPYSSGTTGLPKGVELAHRSIVVNLVQQDVSTVRQYDETTNTNQDITLGILPFYHIYGLSLVLLHKLSIGSKVVTMPRFQPNTFISVLNEYPINLMYVVPPLLLFLSSHSEVTKKQLASIKTIGTGAAPLPTSDGNKLLEKAKADVNFLNLYGNTENAPLVTTTLPGSRNYNTVGYGISNTELRVVDSDLRPLGVNEVGELLIRGPQLMKGYRNNSQATKDSITEDGWYRSGDLASIDESGVVTIADRLKELIKVKGYQVPPAELESVLKEHPNILDAAVVGVPHSRTGEFPKAFVVLQKGHRADSKEILSFVDKRVAEFKRIKEIMFLDEIPRNPSGKILRRVLKEKYC